jgi:hypothetical protein
MRVNEKSPDAKPGLEENVSVGPTDAMILASPAANPRSPRRSAPDVEYINRVQDQNAV